VVEENMKALIAKVASEQADLGIGLDGDADRIGVVDRKGRLLAGDELLNIYAVELLARQPKSTIIGDVKCSQRLFDDITAHGGIPVMWTTGHSIIKARMREVGSPLAGEMSGHMFFSEGWYGFDDGIYGAARLIGILSAMQKDLSELPGWPPAFSTREISQPCPDNIKFAVIKKAQDFFAEKYPVNKQDGARVTYPDGWGLVRASNTQPALVMRFEAATQDRLAEIQKEIQTPLVSWIEEMG
jgi:phosphomannomutase/phosphoglucomutase